ncbi:unnamed protein product [Echinostoma caproni]|uniref:Fibronectin type III domain-containing protein n=1 Tax=Echinostoma caproni TaxID=27848 RepID=A0A183ACZ6_9TREM|nr:unnamed protein product [Echinostoma caproni]
MLSRHSRRLLIEMIRLLIVFFGVLSLGQGQTEGTVDPEAPVITLLNNTAEGIFVSWVIPSNLSVLKQSIDYRDSDGRQREMIVQPVSRMAYLRLIRPCLAYTVQVIVVLQDGRRLSSAPREIVRTASPIPPPPTDLQIQEHPIGFELIWTLPLTEAPISKLKIIGRGDNGDLVEQSVLYDQTSATLTSFQLFQGYNLTMISENSCGMSNESEAVRLEALLKPEAPVILGTVPGINEITLLFQKSENNERVYSFYVNYTTPDGTVSLPPVPGSSSNVTLTEGIESCVKYEIDLWAWNPAGISEAAHTTGYALSTNKPSSPQNVAASGTGQSLFLKWLKANPQELLDEYDLLLVNLAGNAVTYWIPPTADTFHLDGLDSDATYALSLEAKNACGWSDPVDMLIEIGPDGTATPLAVNDRIRDVLSRARRAVRSVV